MKKASPDKLKQGQAYVMQDAKIDKATADQIIRDLKQRPQLLQLTLEGNDIVDCKACA